VTIQNTLVHSVDTAQINSVCLVDLKHCRLEGGNPPPPPSFKMIVRNITYDNLGIARGYVASDSGNEYVSCLDRNNNRVWCSCPVFTFNKIICKHVMALMNSVEYDRMVKKEKLDRISTDCQIIDDLLGGGIPFGIVTGLFGKPMSGKSFFAYQMIIKFLADTTLKAMYKDTEGLRERDLRGLLYRLGERFNVSKKDIDERVVIKTTLGDTQLRSVQKLLQMFGTMVTFTQSAGGKITPIFQACTPSIKQNILENDFGLLVIDSLTKPIKDGITSTTSNLPTRSQVQERIFGELSNLATRSNMAILVNHHVSSNPVMPFGTDFGKPVGGDSIMYNTKYTLEFWDATNKIKKDSGFGLEARRVRLYRHPTEQIDGVWHVIRLKKDYGYTDQ